MPAADLQPGTLVGEYSIDRVIGEGSFGKVYAATHPVIGKTVAVKVLALEHAHKPQQVSRFIEEARAVNRIRHKNIVDIFSFGQLPDGRHYFVMELLEGKTLGAYMEERGRLPVDEALPLLRKMARALDAAHAAGIAHRDLKPDNLMLLFDEDGITPKLLDFGIAKLMDDSQKAHRTATGVQMGTPLYMSPEQCRGQAVDHRTDMYSFGVLVHEMLSGRRLFDQPTVPEVMVAHMSQDPPRLSEIAADLPPGLDVPVLKLLAKDPAARPATIGAAVEEMAAACQRGSRSAPYTQPSANAPAATVQQAPPQHIGGHYTPPPQ
jgi:serine/threonine-protein kinase